MTDAPFHLLLPLAASMLFTLGLILTKRASMFGATTWMIVVVANSWAALMFTSLWFTESKPVPWDLLWQPLLIGVLYIGGQSFTFLALDRGDVSVAAPVLSTKILAVAILLAVVSGEYLSHSRWAAVVLALAGIILVQCNDRNPKPGKPNSSPVEPHHDRRHLFLSIVFALAAATTFAMFDVLVQRWARVWGSGHFLPIVFWTGCALSMFYLPLVPRSSWRQAGLASPLAAGTFCIALQGLCLVGALGYFGDAARVNVVYALRGLWGVVFAFALAKRFDMQEQYISGATKVSRLIGAILLTGAVILALLN